MRKLAAPAALLLFALSATAAAGAEFRIFEATRADEVFRVVLDRNALLLETINAVIKQKGIEDGHVTVTAGSVSECTYHYVASAAVKPVDVFKTVKGAFEILNAGGIIANGQPHIHMTLSSPKGAFGGHLENGCRILYLGEVTIIKYAGGPKLERRPNEHGITLLQAK